MIDYNDSPLEAIKVATFNGANFLGRESEIGCLAQGKRADLFVVNRDPSTRIEDIRKNVELVFKGGVGYDSEKLIKSCEGVVGLK